MTRLPFAVKGISFNAHESFGLASNLTSMGSSSRTTFTKRQKERSRKEKRAEKLQRKAERKQVGEASAASTQPVDDLVVTHDEEGQPQGFDFHDFGR
jgi:hypothetical protein